MHSILSLHTPPCPWLPLRSPVPGTLLFRAEIPVLPFQPTALPMGEKRSISHQRGLCITHSKSKCLSHLGKFCYLQCWESNELQFPQQSSFHFHLSRLQLWAIHKTSAQTKWESPGVRHPCYNQLPIQALVCCLAQKTLRRNRAWAQSPLDSLPSHTFGKQSPQMWVFPACCKLTARPWSYLRAGLCQARKKTLNRPCLFATIGY